MAHHRNPSVGAPSYSRRQAYQTINIYGRRHMGRHLEELLALPNSRVWRSFLSLYEEIQKSCNISSGLPAVISVGRGMTCKNQKGVGKFEVCDHCNPFWRWLRIYAYLAIRIRTSPRGPTHLTRGHYFLSHSVGSHYDRIAPF